MIRRVDGFVCRCLGLATSSRACSSLLAVRGSGVEGGQETHVPAQATDQEGPCGACLLVKNSA